MGDAATVRKRPGMYIGDTDDGSGLHNMVWEIVDYAFAEALAGFANRIEVTLSPDGSCAVRDNGRGFPTDTVPGRGVSASELIMTELYYSSILGARGSGDLLGVGAAVVNALSEWLTLRIWRERQEHCIHFRKGDPVAPPRVTGETEDRGTEIAFLPDKTIFTNTDFDFSTIELKLRKLATRPATTFVLTDRRGAKEIEVILN